MYVFQVVLFTLTYLVLLFWHNVLIFLRMDFIKIYGATLDVFLFLLLLSRLWLTQEFIIKARQSSEISNIHTTDILRYVTDA